MDKIKIRRYRKEDLGEIKRLNVLALKSVDKYPRNIKKLHDDLNKIEEVYLNNKGEFVVGFVNRKVVAMGGLQKISNQTAEIKRMRVHPNYQRKGIGQAVLNKLEAKAFELGYKMLVLDTRSYQLSAQNFYRKNGYLETKRKKSNGFEIIFFEKKLKK